MSQETIGITCAMAQEIMGDDNFIGVDFIAEEVARRHNGPFFEKNPFEKLYNIPIAEEELEKYKERDFVLVPGCPLRILDFFAMGLFDLDFKFEDSWYINFPFAKEEKVDPCWYLFGKNIISDSLGKTYNDWQTMLKNGEEVPRACELLYITIFYNIFTGTRLFRKFFAGCKETILDEYHLHIGISSETRELGIRYYSGNPFPSWVGVAPIKKLVVL